MATITPRVREILETATTDGPRLVITERLSREDYKAVNDVLTRIGGNWSRKDKAHVFAADPARAIAALLDGGDIPHPARKAEGYVPTPARLATALVADHTDIADTDAPLVLEPSAGDGSLVRAILSANPRARVVAVESNAGRAAELADRERVELHTEPFEKWATLELLAKRRDRFDAVVMNPPFATLGHPTVWIDHVKLAFALLRPGGRLVAILPAGYVFRGDKRHAAIRAMLKPLGGHVDLPDDVFGGVRTVVAWADKPLDWNEPALARRRGKADVTPEERAERAESDRELTDHAEAILNDPAALERVQVRIGRGNPSAKVRGYSLRNQILLLAQCEARGMTLTDVDTAAGWAKRGRRLRAGVAGLRITGYSGGDEKKDAPGAEPADEAGVSEQPAARPRFRMMSVFEVSQTASERGADALAETDMAVPGIR